MNATIIERLQQSAQMTNDHNAAHALHAAVVEIRKLEAAVEAARCGVVDDMRRFKCEKQCRAKGNNGTHE